MLNEAAKRLVARTAEHLGAPPPGYHLFLAPINWLRTEAGVAPHPFNHPAQTLPLLEGNPQWSHLSDLREVNLCTQINTANRPSDPLPRTLVEPFAQWPGISRLHLATDAPPRRLEIHTFRDVLFAHRGDRFCILQGTGVDAQSTALPGPAMVRRWAADQVVPVETMAYCGDCHSPGNPAHSIVDHLTRALILRDTVGLAPEEIYLPRSSAPLTQSMQEAVDPRFPIAQPDTIYSVKELILCSDTLGGSSHCHPFHYCDAPLMADMARTAERMALRGTGHGPRIYLSRGGMARRRLTNEPELEEVLREKGFRSLRMETISGADQLASIRQADVIVAPHGGALTSLFAARHGTHCVELFNPRVGTMAFAMICARRALRHTPVFGEAAEGEDWRVDIDDVLAAI